MMMTSDASTNDLEKIILKLKKFLIIQYLCPQAAQNTAVAFTRRSPHSTQNFGPLFSACTMHVSTKIFFLRENSKILEIFTSLGNGGRRDLTGSVRLRCGKGLAGPSSSPGRRDDRGAVRCDLQYNRKINNEYND